MAVDLRHRGSVRHRESSPAEVVGWPISAVAPTTGWLILRWVNLSLVAELSRALYSALWGIHTERLSPGVDFNLPDYEGALAWLVLRLLTETSEILLELVVQQ